VPKYGNYDDFYPKPGRFSDIGHYGIVCHYIIEASYNATGKLYFIKPLSSTKYIPVY